MRPLFATLVLLTILVAASLAQKAWAEPYVPSHVSAQERLLACLRYWESDRDGRYPYRRGARTVSRASRGATHRGSYQIRVEAAELAQGSDPTRRSARQQDRRALELLRLRGIERWPTPARMCQSEYRAWRASR